MCLSGFINQLESLELPPHSSSDVLHVMERTQKSFKFQELRVILVIKPRLDGNSVVHLIPKGVRRVVDEHSLGQISAKHIQVLQVISLNGQARLAIKAVMNVFPLWERMR